MHKSQIICISGTRKSGKDTLLKFLHAIDFRITRLAFADKLKEDLTPLLLEQFGIDPFDCDDKSKELIRPIMIAYGCAWRETDENHWVKEVVYSAKKIHAVNNSTIVAISDVRFMNELSYFRKEYKENMFHIDISRVGAPKPTDEEEKHFEGIRALADYKLNWGEDNATQILEKTNVVYQWLLSKGLEPRQA
jgi:hypothetical protein